jgi:hypothetical protein
MPSKWEFVRETIAPLPKVEAILIEPSFVEELSKRHPGTIKKVSIRKREGYKTTYEQQTEIMGMRFNSLVSMTINLAGHEVLLETLEGTGTGSRILITFKETPSGGTQLKFSADMELGPLGFLAKGRAKAAMEKTGDEDARFLDSQVRS